LQLWDGGKFKTSKVNRRKKIMGSGGAFEGSIEENAAITAPARPLYGQGRGLHERGRGMAAFSQLEPRHVIGAQSSGPGLVLLAGTPLTPVYANPEAIQILTYPEDPTKITGLDRFITGKIRTLLSDRSHQPWSTASFVSGNRNYLCRAFSLKSGNETMPRVPGQPEVALLLERGGSGVDSSRLAEQYRLTAREHETLRFLVMGLTNKDIAGRMHVSPHTVKAFLRTIMIKTGASTRSGIVGRCSSPPIGTSQLGE
jgi:DNA-binding CsgD family transcriptional regulator